MSQDLSVKSFSCIFFVSRRFAMGVVTASSSAARTPVGLNKMYSSRVSLPKMPIILSFKKDENKSTALVAPRESVALPSESNKENRKRLRKVKKRMERINAVSTEDASPSTLELDYSEAAEKLENIYKRSFTTVDFDEDVKTQRRYRRDWRRKRTGETEEIEKKSGENVARSQRKGKRLNLEKRIAMKMKKESEFVESSQKKKDNNNDEDEKIDRLVRDYMASSHFGSLDWKTMKMPPVLPSSEHEWLFKLMQPMKEILKTKETLQTDLGREVTHKELAEATNMDVVHLRRQLEVGQAARIKLIKHNLRLVLFVVNKHFHQFADGPRYQDLCQAGVRGLIVAIDRFEPRRKFRLSTYAIFWIRHAIVRFLTISSFLKVPFGLESVRVEIQKAKNDLRFELQRMPTDEEIIKQVGISPERYRDVMRISQPILSLHDRHPVTQEEFINGIPDVEGDKRKHPALLRLALDDVLDSLKPKESMVIRQRYGLDGKGNRTLGEIAGNLNISREMVRKHELKALMKLKHPARVDYLRHYIFK